MNAPYTICERGHTSRGHHAFCECGAKAHVKTSPEGRALIAAKLHKGTCGYPNTARAGRRPKARSYGEHV